MAAEDRQWLPYQNGQEVVFQNATGQADTLIVVLKTGMRQDGKCEESFSEFIEGEIKSKTKSGIFIDFVLAKITLSVFGGIPNPNGGRFGAELMRSEDLPEGRLRTIDSNSSLLKNVTSGARTYPEALLVVRTSNYSPDKLRSFLLAYSAGVVEFESSDGQQWFLKQ